MYKNPIIMSLMLLALTVTHRGNEPDAAKLHINTTATHYELTVPVSRLIMKIPKGGLLPAAEQNIGGATASPRYFRFVDEAKGLTISGWFENANGFTSAKKSWDAEVESWKKNHLPSPENVTFNKLGGWDTVRYDTKLPGGTDCHIRAYWVQAGTWIDVHISIASKAKPEELRQILETLLASIQVSEKPE
jgi:hypothetical protein